VGVDRGSVCRAAADRVSSVAAVVGSGSGVCPPEVALGECREVGRSAVVRECQRAEDRPGAAARAFSAGEHRLVSGRQVGLFDRGAIGAREKEKEQGRRSWTCQTVDDTNDTWLNFLSNLKACPNG
jgi:hypothetical protein